MYILNFSHPLTTENLNEIAGIMGDALHSNERIVVIDIPVQCDRQKPIIDEAKRILASVPWLDIGAADVLINPPGLSVLAVAIGMQLATDQEDYIMLGFLNVRQVAGSVPTRFEVAEVYG